jgi:pimeloyl-ACP methyl ester carboxylesterase
MRGISPIGARTLVAAAACGITALAPAAALSQAHTVTDSPNTLVPPHLGPPPVPTHSRAGSEKASRAAAHGHLRMFKCNEAPDGRCGRVRVPLDRTDPSGPTVSLFFEYFRHRARGPSHEAILATEGGPGFSITQDQFVGPFYRDLFDPLMRKRDLILLDQRGVGRSQVVNCRQVQHGSDDIYADTAACADQLGSAATLYGSGNVALDINAVRRALGIRKLDMYGGSYAAQDIQSYALRFPEHVRAAILDSPFTNLGFDEFSPTTSDAVDRAVRLLCERSQSCSRERDNAVRSLAWLLRHLRSHPLEGTGFDASGEPHDVHVTEAYVFWHMIQTEDGGFVADSEIGAAADALAAGDDVPLLRLAAEGDNPIFGDEGGPRHYSVGLNFARFCTDNPMPWDKGAAVPERFQQFEEAKAALPADQFAPYSVNAILAQPPAGVIGPDPCIEWPAPQHHIPPPMPPGATFPPQVPALILNGDLDFSTPTVDSRRLADAWPGSHFIELADSGHHTALNARFDCSDAILLHFIVHLLPGDSGCAKDIRLISFPAVGRFAQTAAGARQADVDHGAGDQSTPADRRVANVATSAITDALRHAFLQPQPTTARGLRGGTVTPSFGDNVFSVDLAGARFAEDVGVTGTADYRFDTQAIDATVTVDGPGSEDGHLNVRGAWFAFGFRNTVLRIRGVLDDRHVAVHVPAT